MTSPLWTRYQWQIEDLYLLSSNSSVPWVTIMLPMNFICSKISQCWLNSRSFSWCELQYRRFSSLHSFAFVKVVWGPWRCELNLQLLMTKFAGPCTRLCLYIILSSGGYETSLITVWKAAWDMKMKGFTRVHSISGSISMACRELTKMTYSQQGRESVGGLN